MDRLEKHRKFSKSNRQRRIISTSLAFIHRKNRFAKFQSFYNFIRPFTVGRKNWLFNDSPKGAKASAAVYSLIETSKANGLDPEKYLRYVLSEMPGKNFRDNPEMLEGWMPWSKGAQDNCKV